MKKCKICGEIKENFYCHRGIISSYCDECRKEKLREYYKKNIDKIKEYNKTERRKETKSEYQKKYRSREEVKKRMRAYYKIYDQKEPRKTYILEYHKKYYQKKKLNTTS